MNIEEIPVPASAKTGTISGRYEVQLDAATNTIFSELKKTHPKVQEKILFLSAETNASQVFDFYNSAMPGKGFTSETKSPVQGINYLQNVWKKGDQAVSVAVIEAGNDSDGKPIQFLAIHTGEK